MDEFHHQLENWLARRRGLKGLRIWRDRELDGNTHFNVAIKDKLDSTALFFVLHSRAYRRSNYCGKELDWFHGKHQDNLLVGEHKRIFNTLLNNNPPNKWSPVLGNAIGFSMHDAEDDQLGDFIFPANPGISQATAPNRRCRGDHPGGHAYPADRWADIPQRRTAGIPATHGNRRPRRKSTTHHIPGCRGRG